MIQPTTSGRLFLLLLLSTLLHQSITLDTITSSHSLIDGQTLVSADGTFALGFFSPANSTNRYVGIWFNKITVQTVVWVANRNNPITSDGTLSITSDGSLTIKGKNSTIIWSTGATTVNNPVAQLLNTGNFVVREAINSDELQLFGWQSFDHPTDTLLPGMKLGINMKTKLNRNLTSWRTDTDPSSSDYTMAMDTRGDPQLTMFYNGSTRKWRSGPWTGLGFSGDPAMRSYSNGFSFNYVNDNNEITYSYTLSDKSVVTRLVANQTGAVQRWVWLDRPQVWNLFWYSPNEPCDGFAVCGPYGVCDQNSSPICGCMQGFEPKSNADWRMRDGRDGCVRKTKLDCETDGFVKLSGQLLPDTMRSTVWRNMSLEECRDQCLMNCSCTGYANADVRGGGSGCIIWVSELLDLELFVDGGQDLYVKLAAADLASTPAPRKSHKNGGTIVAVTVSLSLSLIILASVCCWLRRKRKRKRNRTTKDYDASAERYIVEEFKSRPQDLDIELPLYEMGTLMAATDNFSLQNLLGEGGFGYVYKGMLDDGHEIAVKRLSKTSMQGSDEFKNEVMLIAKLQHRNLVRLLGYCIQGEEMMLIYEYMANKSLNAFLFDKDQRISLDWNTRCCIISGIARGLLYLHQDSRFRIIHRDLKASNILLDKEMNPKISDFGLARIFGGDDAVSHTKRVVGTYGYMSPEYAMDGIFSIKSDVYSFGVLILEIISGRKNRAIYLSEPHHCLVENAWQLWNEGKCLELADVHLDCSSSSLTMKIEVARIIQVGLLCVQEWPEDRPTMSSVVFMLDSRNALCPEPKHPGFVARRGSSKPNLNSTKIELNSVNNATVTMVTGR